MCASAKLFTRAHLFMLICLLNLFLLFALFSHFSTTGIVCNFLLFHIFFILLLPPTYTKKKMLFIDSYTVHFLCLYIYRHYQMCYPYNIVYKFDVVATESVCGRNDSSNGFPDSVRAFRLQLRYGHDMRTGISAS